MVDSPIGALTLTWDDASGVLRGLHVHDQRTRPADPAFGLPDAEACEPLDALVVELDEYFAGRLREFATPIAPEGSAFAREVWAALREVPYGEVTTYGALAAAVGRPRAAQAVGTANGRNPISLLVPCHRVVTAAGEPSGGGPGIARKRRLHDLECGELPSAGG